MIKPFFIMVAVLMVAVGMVGFHYMNYNVATVKKNLQVVSKLTGISSVSLSVSYYEPRVLFYEKMDNPAYPQMLSINKMDFIYAR